MESRARMIYQDSKILEILVGIGALSKDSRDLIERFMSKWNLDAYDAVVDTNTVSSEELKSILANHYGLSSIDSVGTICLSEECLSTIDFEHALRWFCIPLGVQDAGKQKTIKVAISDPSSDALLNEIRQTTGCILDPVVGTRKEIHVAIFKDYPVEQQMPFVCGVSKDVDAS